MITVREEPARDERRREIAALVVSVLLNLLLLWPLLASLFNVKLALQRNPERQEFIVSSSAIRIERRTPVPVPKQQPQKTVPTPAQPQPKHTVVVHQPPAPRHELSRENPNAPPQPPARKAPTLAQTLAKQEQDFAREAQQIHESNNPLSIATIAPQPPSTWHRSYADLQGRDQQEHVFALLTVREKFETPTLHCYYVRYDAQFSGGGTEDGTIPWPVCYPKDHDAMLPLNKSHTLPVPAPPPGFVLPAGTTLTPLMQQIYDGRIQT